MFSSDFLLQTNLLGVYPSYGNPQMVETPYAFSRGGLVRLEIPRSVTFVGTEAFRDCEALRDVTLPAEVSGQERREMTGVRAMPSGAGFWESGTDEMPPGKRDLQRLPRPGESEAPWFKDGHLKPPRWRIPRWIDVFSMVSHGFPILYFNFR